jgi:hypothetical protein
MRVRAPTPSDRVAEDALANGAVERVQGVRIAAEDRRREIAAQHAVLVSRRRRCRAIKCR